MSHSELPATSDFYALESILPDRDRALLAQVRAFMREEVAPIINDYWSREEFPHQVFPRMAELGMGGMALAGYGCAERGVLVDGFVAMEMWTVRSRPDWAGTTTSRWARSITAGLRSRSRHGCRGWRPWRRSALSV